LILSEADDRTKGTLHSFSSSIDACGAGDEDTSGNGEADEWGDRVGRGDGTSMRLQYAPTFSLPPADATSGANFGSSSACRRCGGLIAR
jgi:hypothetical protein